MVRRTASVSRSGDSTHQAARLRVTNPPIDQSDEPFTLVGQRYPRMVPVDSSRVLHRNLRYSAVETFAECAPSRRGWNPSCHFPEVRGRPPDPAARR